MLIIAKASLVNPATRIDTLLDENNQLIPIFVESITTAPDDKRKTS